MDGEGVSIIIIEMKSLTHRPLRCDRLIDARPPQPNWLGSGDAPSHRQRTIKRSDASMRMRRVSLSVCVYAPGRLNCKKQSKSSCLPSLSSPLAYGYRSYCAAATTTKTKSTPQTTITN
jgi:hypothetical protein